MNKGVTIWFTGLPCCGKTTIADELTTQLKHMNIRTERLDGDIVRKTICKDLGFSKEDREKNIERVTYISKLLTRNGVLVLSTFISPYKAVRDRARKEIGNFIEIFVDCPVEVCEARDVKGMYKLAREGKIKNFTGISDPYEKPLYPEVHIKSDERSIDDCVEKILDYLVDEGWI